MSLIDTSQPRTEIKIIPFYACNRVESRPRQGNFEKSLKAEIHDPLWMLGRQWQMGEFTGTDSGSGICAKVQMDYQQIFGIDQFGANAPIPYDQSVPLEPLIESIPYNFSIKERIITGKKWLLFLKQNLNSTDYSTCETFFLNTQNGFLLNLTMPTTNMSSDEKIAGGQIFSNNNLKNFLSTVSSVNKLGIDGSLVYQKLSDAAWASNFPSNFTTPTTTLSTGIGIARQNFIAWVEKIYQLPTFESGTWDKNSLEYKFDAYWPVYNTTTSQQARLSSSRYHQGHFDWYAFNQDTVSSFTNNLTNPQSNTNKSIQLIMSRSSFPGMPSSRWWEFEDGRVNFCNLQGNTSDISKIILTQFALTYHNDWYLIPYKVPVGCYSKVRGIVVTDVFGINTFVANYPICKYDATGFHEETANQNDPNYLDWARWRWMDISLSTSVPNAVQPTNSIEPAGVLIIPPVTDDVMQSKPIESVVFIKDEVADMVFGVEKIIPDNLGKGVDGYTAASALTNYLEILDNSQASAPNNLNDAKLNYQLSVGNIPENWIPFIPVHVTGSNRKIQFQRAAMPRLSAPYNNSLIRPRTEILNSGLHYQDYQSYKTYPHNSSTPAYNAYHIYEEEIPRAGAIVQTSFQRTRWYNGKTILWVGRRKTLGRGEGSGGLTFDKINNS